MIKFDGSCFECISEANVKYVVVNQDYYKTLLDYPVVFSKGSFLVYLKKGEK